MYTCIHTYIPDAGRTYAQKILQTTVPFFEIKKSNIYINMYIYALNTCMTKVVSKDFLWREKLILCIHIHTYVNDESRIFTTSISKALL